MLAAQRMLLSSVASYVITDNFNGADHSALGATSDGKATWTIEAGTWEHLSNQAHMTAGGVNGYAVASVPGTSADGTVQVSANNQHQGLAFRIVDGAHFYLATMGTLYKVAAGTFTALATTGGLNSTPFSVELSGSSIIVKQSGGVLASVTDTTYTSTKHGIYSDRSFAADLLEDFSWTT